MKKTIIMLMLAASAMFAAEKAQMFMGVVTDNMCRDNHKPMGVTPDGKCVRDCVHANAKYALYDGKHTYVLSDQQTPEKFAGEKVMVMGVLDAKAETIQVQSIKAGM